MRTYLFLTLATAGGLLAVFHPALGQNWTLTSAPTNGWFSVASSADGTKLVAVGNPSIYTSTDSGTTWMLASAPANSYSSVASSADGTKLVAAAWSTAPLDQFGAIYSLSQERASGAPLSETSSETLSKCEQIDRSVRQRLRQSMRRRRDGAVLGQALSIPQRIRERPGR
jgi:hypothetical protein